MRAGLKPDTILRQLQAVAMLGLPSRTAVPEMLRLVQTAIPGAFVSFYWIDQTGAVQDLCAPQVLLDAMGPVLVEYDRLDPAREPTLDKLLAVGGAIDNSADVHATHDFTRSFMTQEMMPALGVGLGIDLVIRLRGRPVGILFVNRERAFSSFSPAERALLERMHDQFAHALAAGRLAGSDPAAAAPAQADAERQGVLMAAPDGAILSATREALQLLVELGDVLGVAPDARRALLERLPPALQSLARATSAAARELQPAPPMRAWRSAGGDFTARGFVQRALGDGLAAAEPVTLLITRHVPPPIALFRRVAALPLAPRERQIAWHLAGGAPPDAIAARLGITAQTLRGYLKSIYAKTGAAGQIDLVRRLA